ncbi:MAG: acyl carrier protein [Tatlockia sp.]|jgi:acyl carrier protein|nr:acyl carrier protein [Tatlockia sp.]
MAQFLIEDEATFTETRRNSPSEKEIQTWLVNSLAAELKINPKEIDVKSSFSRYGLDSLAAVNLVSQLEEWLKIELPPTLPYEYPTIELLAEYLSSMDESTAR